MAYPQATPVRPLPGAFINTPAVARAMAQQDDPVRRRLFPDVPPTSTSAAGLPGAAAPAAAPAARSRTEPLVKLPTVDPASPLTKAAGTINKLLQHDGEYPDIDSYCRRKNRPCSPSPDPWLTAPSWRLL